MEKCDKSLLKYMEKCDLLSTKHMEKCDNCCLYEKLFTILGKNIDKI